MAKSVGRPAWFKIFLNQKATLDAIPDENVGKALKAILHYFDTGEVSTLDPMTFIAFSGMKPSVDESFEDYEKASEKNRENVRKRWEKAKQFDTAGTSGNDSLPSGTEAEAETETEGEKRKKKEGSAPPPPKVTKHKHGEYNNVLLTDEELENLQAEFPTDLESRINKLSEYIASTGKTYKSHYATIRSWARKDKEDARKPRYGYPANPCDSITAEDHERDSENPW